MSYFPFSEIKDEYTRIMLEEARFNPACKTLAYVPLEMYRRAELISEIAKSSTQIRGWNKPYGLSDRTDFTCESIGAHTNLMLALLETVLYNYRLPKQAKSVKKSIKKHEGYKGHTIRMAAFLHDLAENETGDIIDNGQRDDEAQKKIEEAYFGRLINRGSLGDTISSRKTQRLLNEMNDHELLKMRRQKTINGEVIDFGPKYIAGRLLYAADKFSAALIVLSCDYKAKELKNTQPPMLSRNYPFASARDKEEMSIADEKGPFVKASEMWTIDIMKLREINQYDDTGFFTGLLVMYTLMVNGHWYSWREENYKNAA